MKILQVFKNFVVIINVCKFYTGDYVAENVFVVFTFKRLVVQHVERWVGFLIIFVIHNSFPFFVMYDYIIHERAYITRLFSDFVCNFRDFKRIFALFHKSGRLTVQNLAKCHQKTAHWFGVRRLYE